MIKKVGKRIKKNCSIIRVVCYVIFASSYVVPVIDSFGLRLVSFQHGNPDSNQDGAKSGTGGYLSNIPVNFRSVIKNKPGILGLVMRRNSC